MGKPLNFKIISKKSDKELQLDDFISELEAIKKTIDAIYKSQNSKGKLKYNIVRIKKESPAELEIEPYIENDTLDTANKVVERFYHGLDSLSKGVLPIDFDYDVLKAFSEMGKKSDDGGSVEFFNNNFSTSLIVDENFQKNVDKFVKKSYNTSFLSASGKLDALNLHGKDKIIYIYPNFAPKIKCNIPEKLEDKIRGAVKRKVTVTGKAKIKIGEKDPFEIDVEDIKIHKLKSEIPNPDELWGIWKNADDRPSEIIISDIRNEQD